MEGFPFVELAEQAAILDYAYRLLGQQHEQVQALEAENQALRRALDGAGTPWDWSDERSW